MMPQVTGIKLCEVHGNTDEVIGGSEGGPRGAVPPLAFLLPPLGSQLIPETGIMYSYCIQKYRKQMGK